MLKDGSGWGAMAGVSAGILAAGGFTGAPAITVEADDVANHWQDLGQHWMIMDQGFKVHAVCWWAQPAIEATLQLVRSHQLAVPEIDSIEIETFEKATHLDHSHPATSEEAQYSLPYPVAAALWAWAEHSEGWFGLGPAQLLEDHLTDERVLQLAERINLVEAADLTARFPKKFLARATITTRDGRTFRGADTTFRGELDFPLTEADLRAKYRWLAEGLLPQERAATLEKLIFELPELDTIQPILDLLTPPPDAKF
jgi:2-methylcitrate dehydratase PrpD